MFEDRLQETILNEMLSEFGSDVRTDEGSLAYNACVKIASELEDTYMDLDELNDNMLPDTQDIDHLIRYAKCRGIEYNYATNPIVKGTFLQEIEIGERFTCNDYTYQVMELINHFTYKLKCETEGTAANGNVGDLYPVDYIDEYKGGRIVGIIENGIDDEEDEKFRQRVLDSFNPTAFCGNKADYRNYINAIPGVGGCKPKRRDTDSNWIYIWIINNDNNEASEELISKVQTLVDPEQNHGEGDGMAPICHNVLIRSAENEVINVSMKIKWDDGYSTDTSKSQIVQVVNDYLKGLRKSWESNELNDTIVRLSQIDARVLTIEGTLDVTETTLNDKEENIILDYTKIPVLGGVTIV